MGPTVDLTSHREYTSCLTQVQNRPVLVCSTGMGGPSTAICLEELARLGIKRVIRVGTTGSIQEGLELGDVVIIKAAVRLEGTSAHYAPLEFPAVADFELTQLLAYAALVESVPHQVGICCSSDTFWPGQERYDSFTGYVLRRFQGSMKEWQQLGVTNYENGKQPPCSSPPRPWGCRQPACAEWWPNGRKVKALPRRKSTGWRRTGSRPLSAGH